MAESAEVEIARIERAINRLRKESEALWTEREKRLDERWRAQDVALGKATASLEARLHMLNDLRSNVISREEYESKHEALIAIVGRNRDDLQHVRGDYMTIAGHKTYEDRLATLELWKSNIMGRTIAIALVGAIIVAAVGALFGHLAA